MIDGETIASGANPDCCGLELKLKVLRSAAGWYLGTECPNCGPYSRETNYFKTEEIANKILSEEGVKIMKRQSIYCR